MQHDSKSWRHTSSGTSAVLFDTCSEVNLISQFYADSLGLKYVTNNTLESQALGGNGTVLGQIEGAFTCALNDNTQVLARTFHPVATAFLVVKNVQHMYDILFSIRCLGCTP
jgi:hypothetical protein